jgi:formylmethanofuran dehydrogenase subunit E
MKTLDQFIADAAKDGETRSGIILGIRMALRALKELGIEDIGHERRRLAVFVEIDRCLPDAIQIVTGCRLGNRTLKFRDFGKMAATFVDLRTNRAVRIAALDGVRQKAAALLSEEEKEDTLRHEYRTRPDEGIFRCEWVRVTLLPEELPGARRDRVPCAECREWIGLGREVVRADKTLCRYCAGEAYYTRLTP